MNEKTPVKSQAKLKTNRPTLTIIAILIGLVALTIGGFSLHQQQQDAQLLKSQLIAAQQTASNLQASVSQLQSSLSKQQQAITKLAQAHHHNQTALIVILQALQAAQLNLQLGGRASNSLHVLVLADKHLMQLHKTALNPVRKALAHDIETLKSLPNLDVSGLIFRLDAISTQIQKLKLKDYHHVVAQPKTKMAQVWWHTLLERLKGFITIHHYQHKISALLAPNDFAQLKQNVTAKILQAQWAVLHQNNKLYQANLSLIISWLTPYDQQMGASLAPIITSIKELQHFNVKPNVPNIQPTIKLLQNYMQGKVKHHPTLHTQQKPKQAVEA